jgi:uncharacterized membrane protein (UPF0127 family)
LDSTCLPFRFRVLFVFKLQVRVIVSRALVPFAHMTHDKRGNNVLEIKSGVIREHRIQGLLNHEIGGVLII